MTAVSKAELARSAHADARRGLRRRVINESVRYAILIGACLLALLPMLWIWADALKSPAEVAADSFSLPQSVELGNLGRAWTVGNYGRYFGNTLVYCVAIVALIAILSSLAGYAFGALRFRGRDALFAFFLVGVIVPFQAVMIPEYYLARDLGLIGTYWGYILPGAAFQLGFGIFLMRAAFRALSQEIAAAARVDGANEWQIFRRVMLPLAMPSVATLIIFEFMWTWKNFLVPLVMVQNDPMRPVSLGVLFFFGRYSSDLGMIAAGATISSLPIVIVYILLQRYITQGLAEGALKG